jgi:hypothetical protein
MMMLNGKVRPGPGNYRGWDWLLAPLTAWQPAPHWQRRFQLQDKKGISGHHRCIDDGGKEGDRTVRGNSNLMDFMPPFQPIANRQQSEKSLGIGWEISKSDFRKTAVKPPTKNKTGEFKILEIITSEFIAWTLNEMASQ